MQSVLYNSPQVGKGPQGGLYIRENGQLEKDIIKAHFNHFYKSIGSSILRRVEL